jgi:flagellar hook-associated protein 3 FlgL
MSTNGVSTSSTFLLLQTILNNNETTLNNLSQQLSTGQVSSTLAGFGNQAQTVLNLAAGTQTEQGYVQNNSVINTYLSGYSTSLTQLQNDATTLQGALQAFSINDPTTVTNLNDVLQGVMEDVSATLNSQVGNRFIFSGTDSRLTTSPVVDDLQGLLSTQVAAGLPATAPTSNFTLAGPGDPTGTPPVPGTLPFYDTAEIAANATPPTPLSAQTVQDAYGTQTAAVANNQQITFGVSSNDPSIQALMNSIQNAFFAVSSAQQAQSSTITPAQATQLQANANTYVANAESSVNSALSGGTAPNGTAIGGLPNLEEEVGDTQATLQNVDDVHTQTLGNLQTQTSTLETVNSATVAEQLSAVENQLNASFKVTATLLNLSILTFL